MCIAPTPLQKANKKTVAFLFYLSWHPTRIRAFPVQTVILRHGCCRIDHHDRDQDLLTLEDPGIDLANR